MADFSEKLPGRGAWISADRQAFLEAHKKGSFARALKTPVKLSEPDPEAFAHQLGTHLLGRAMDRLGLARKAGEVVVGADTISRKAKTIAAYIHPEEVSADSVRKLLSRLEESAKSNHIVIPVAAESFGSVLGDPGVVHVGLLSGRVAAGALWELSRWRAFSAAPAANLH